jgi:hypothetical protein
MCSVMYAINFTSTALVLYIEMPMYLLAVVQVLQVGCPYGLQFRLVGLYICSEFNHAATVLGHFICCNVCCDQVGKWFQIRTQLALHTCAAFRFIIWRFEGSSTAKVTTDFRFSSSSLFLILFCRVSFTYSIPWVVILGLTTT